MKAIRYHEYGGPEVMKLEEVPKPVPKDDELLIRVHAMGINPVDWKIREGLVQKRFTLPMPVTPGADLSGVVEQVGASVSGFQVGQQVYAMIGLFGADAEYVAIKATSVAAKPTTMDHVHAASMPLAALTAWQALFEKAGLKSGQRLLVHAAAGGVGGFAVQLARSVGAEVVGTSSPANFDFVRQLGASQVIDYRNADYSSYAQSFDVVIDMAGGDGALQSLKVLKRGGVHVGVVPPSEPLQQGAAAAGITAVPIQVHPDGGQLAQIAALADAGKVTTTVAASFALADIGLAHNQSKTGHTRGKLVLRSSG
jgi:NADPH:quinone reductase-like Zn-dependent oxidoreductase